MRCPECFTELERNHTTLFCSECNFSLSLDGADNCDINSCDSKSCDSMRSLILVNIGFNETEVEGITAWMTGEKIEDNPHNQLGLRRAWEYGYRNEEKASFLLAENYSLKESNEEIEREDTALKAILFKMLAEIDKFSCLLMKLPFFGKKKYIKKERENFIQEIVEITDDLEKI